MATNAALIGAIAAAGTGSAQPPDLPILVDGLQGWVSTTKGQFLFGDGTTAPGHGKAVREARNIQNQQPLFSQATAALRPTWDAVTFDVPCIRSDGTQYLTRSTALAAPGLVIVGCAFDSGSTGFRALTGARSNQTPGGDPAEDAWTLNKSSTDQTRALVATDAEVDHANTPAILGQRLLVLMEVVGNTIQVWQVGSTGQQTIVGARIVADGEQALLAKYYNDSIGAILEGAIFEFAQYAPAPSREVRRLLIQYFQGLIWPAVAPPIAATVDAGQVQQGASKSINVVAPSSGSSLVVASIDEQPAAGGFSISSNNVVIRVPTGAALGNYSGTYCLRSDVPGSRLVDFGRVDFEVVEGEAPLADLPYFGQYYGCGYCGPGGAANSHHKFNTDEAVSYFFFAERSGSIDRISWQVRRSTDAGYSGGDGGTYTIEIRTANANTKRAIPLNQGGQLISRLTGYQPGNSAANSSVYPNLLFTERPGQTVANQPYVVIWRNTSIAPNSHYVSDNVSMHCNFGVGGPASGSSQPANYEEPAGADPQNPGSSPTPVSGWSPVFVDGKAWYDWPLKSINGEFQYNRMGPQHMVLRYDDGQWVSFGAFPSGGGIAARTAEMHGPAQMARERFRVTRANRTVSGVFLRICRLNGTTGTLTVRLEQGPTGDTHFPGNGTVIESVAVPHTAIFDVGVEENVSQGQGDTTPLDFVPWVWVPFSTNRTLVMGTNYNLRLSVSANLSCEMRCVGRWDSPPTNLGPRGASVATWSDWEAHRQVPWGAWEDSRGFQVSTDSGSTWSYLAAELSPILFKCV